LSQPGGDERCLQPGGDEWSLELARIVRAGRRGRGVVEKQPDHMEMDGVHFEEELEQTMATMTRRRLRVSSRIARPGSGDEDTMTILRSSMRRSACAAVTTQRWAKSFRSGWRTRLSSSLVDVELVCQTRWTGGHGPARPASPNARADSRD